MVKNSLEKKEEEKKNYSLSIWVWKRQKRGADLRGWRRRAAQRGDCWKITEMKLSNLWSEYSHSYSTLSRLSSPPDVQICRPTAHLDSTESDTQSISIFIHLKLLLFYRNIEICLSFFLLKGIIIITIGDDFAAGGSSAAEGSPSGVAELIIACHWGILSLPWRRRRRRRRDLHECGVVSAAGGSRD